METTVISGRITDLSRDLQWNAATFEGEINRRAHALIDLGIGQGSQVAIAHSGTAHFFADLFAVWRVGAGAICLDPSLTQRELSILTAFAKPSALLVDGASPIIKFTFPILTLADAPRTELHLVPAKQNGDDPALILFTSGTTGSPKGVVLSFSAIKSRVSLNAAAIGANTLVRTLVTLPTHFGHGLIGNALTPLISGSEIFLHSPSIDLIQNLSRIIEKYSISFLSSVPALWPLALRYNEPLSNHSLTRIHVGSAPLSDQLWSDVVKWAGTEVVNCYGITETANWISGASSKIDGISSGCVGRAWGGQVKVLDEGGAMTEVGEGEIRVRSPTLMSGYLNRPDLTAAVLRNGWFHTGDRGSVDESGRIHLTGRLKEEINRAGFKVQPSEIDLLLQSHPAIADACVFSLSDQAGGEVVAAAVQAADGYALDISTMRSWCLERIRREAVPERWYFVKAIPRTDRGKVNRDTVRDVALNGPQR